MAIAVVLAADQMKIEIKFEIEVGIRKKVEKINQRLEKVTDGITPDLQYLIIGRKLNWPLLHVSC